MVTLEYNSLLGIIKENNNQISEIIEQYTTLLSQLTETTLLPETVFLYNLQKISNIGSIYVCYYKTSENKICIIGSGTIIFEPKIIHSGKNVGHIEDIVVDEKFRSMGIAKKILEQLVFLGNENNCYKVILDANPILSDFYERNGFTKYGIQFAKYFL
jgi:glucosamine-phosphate N-acetyltransferase